MRVVLSLLVSAFLVGDPYECFAQEITVTSTSITNAGSVTYTAGGVAQTISITLGLTDTDGSSGTGTGNTISKISVYFTDNVQYESSTPASTSTAVEKTYTPAKTVTADVTDDKTIIAGETVDLLIDVANCEAYTHVCVVITTGTANTVTDDDGCLPFGSHCTDAGSKVCPAPGVLAASFTSTAPATYTIDTTTAVDFTFSIGLINTGASAVDVTGINVYLSDDESLTTKSAAFAGAGVTFPVSVAAKAAGSTLTTGLTASIVADEAQCSSYKYICAQLAPGNVIGCTVDISSKIDCSSAGSSVGKSALGILLFLSVVVAVFVPGRD
ncbi:uncharacterized protein [Ptychodera flava]|uniref:uncharacterized protein isoform X2 n=1 Tax=Ptychodera flava TaxID=63121 RepID=UPI003969FA69